MSHAGNVQRASRLTCITPKDVTHMRAIPNPTYHPLALEIPLNSAYSSQLSHIQPSSSSTNVHSNLRALRVLRDSHDEQHHLTTNQVALQRSQLFHSHHQILPHPPPISPSLPPSCIPNRRPAPHNTSRRYNCHFRLLQLGHVTPSPSISRGPPQHHRVFERRSREPQGGISRRQSNR